NSSLSGPASHSRSFSAASGSQGNARGTQGSRVPNDIINQSPLLQVAVDGFEPLLRSVPGIDDNFVALFDVVLHTIDELSGIVVHRFVESQVGITDFVLGPRREVRMSLLDVPFLVRIIRVHEITAPPFIGA